MQVILIVGLHFFTAFLFPIMNAQMITTNMLYEGQFACPGDEIVFTCEIEDFNVLAWESDLLIGQGGEQIQFSVQDPMGMNRNGSNPNTFATLTMINKENGALRLVSDLHVTVPSIFSNLSISCSTGNTANMSMTTFTVLGKPGVPKDIFASQFKCNPDKNITQCLITSYWSYNPENSTQAGVNNYDVFINNTIMSNQTTNITGTSSTRISSLFAIGDCGAHVVGVRAINICGQKGDMSPDLILDPNERRVIPDEVCIQNLKAGATHTHNSAAINIFIFVLMIMIIFASP